MFLSDTAYYNDTSTEYHANFDLGFQLENSSEAGNRKIMT